MKIPRKDATNEEMENWLESAIYDDMLRAFRFAEIGHPFFISRGKCREIQTKFSARYTKLKAELLENGHSEASKRVGWTA